MQPSTPTVSIQRDTRAWQVQVWISFGLAVFLCATGLGWLPGQALDRAFMVMGYVFCLSAAFVLAKFVRDNQHGAIPGAGDTPMWKLVVWGGFFLAMGLTGWGLWRMEIQPVWKSYLLVCWLFLIAQVFTLAKTLRDAHDADILEARLAGRRDSAEPQA
jgi:hypothetical protein